MGLVFEVVTGELLRAQLQREPQVWREVFGTVIIPG
jgi:hypothetical protein